MGLTINQIWVDDHQVELLKFLESEFDPHIKRIDTNSLTFLDVNLNENQEPLLELDTEVLEFGSCSGVRCTYHQKRRLKISSGDLPLSKRLISLL